MSLLLSAVMLGVKATSLNAIIRTINRKQELGILIGELKKARSSMPPKVLAERVRRVTEHAPADMGIVRILSQAGPEPASLLEAYTCARLSLQAAALRRKSSLATPLPQGPSAAESGSAKSFGTDRALALQLALMLPGRAEHTRAYVRCSPRR